MILQLPWPPAALNPNRRQHWSQLARAKKRYRAACAMHARLQGAARLHAERLHVRLRFVPPDARRRDLDNVIAAMKSGLDGLADVIGVDDSCWRLSVEMSAVADAQSSGIVNVEVTVC